MVIYVLRDDKKNSVSECESDRDSNQIGLLWSILTKFWTHVFRRMFSREFDGEKNASTV